MNGTTVPRSKYRARSKGAALLSAMLTVVLVATFAAAALWQQWRSVQVEVAERERVQADWVLTGALDWARLVLREDARASGGVDHLGEPWAVPLEEARLSSFLAADQNTTTSGESGSEVFDAFLSGQIVDLQSFMNVTDLVSNGKISEPDLRSFGLLFDLLGIPAAQLDTLAENLRVASDTSASTNPAAPLLPQRVEQLVWLGLPASTVAALEPYVTILPSRTAVNLNTASAEVIYATIAGLSMADAQRLVAVRELSPFRSVQDAKTAVGGSDALFAQVNAGVGSSFFEVRSRLRLDQLVVEQRAIVRRDGVDVRVLQRYRGPAPAVSAATLGEATGGAGVGQR